MEKSVNSKVIGFDLGYNIISFAMGVCVSIIIFVGLAN